MLRRVMKYIRDNELLHTGQPVLVCLSGGADSVALLDVLLRGGYTCVAAHCNFHLRDAESDRDEHFVRALCQERQVPLVCRDFDTFSYAREIERSIEMTARLQRYAWFQEVATEHHCQAIAVAHHQNDQAETLIMNLRRGTGIRGLCGMRAKAANPAGGDIPIVRPLLCTTHDYICHYLRDIRHMDWVEDSTNTDTTYRRNAIRAELSTYSKAEIEHIARTAEIMQGYTDWIDAIQTAEQNGSTPTLSPLAQQMKEYETLRNNR